MTQVGKDFSAIPVLDVSPLYSGDAAKMQQVADRLRGYLEAVGFLYVAGHDVPDASVQAVREASRRFFALPEAEKLRIRIDRNFRGFLPIASSTIVTSSVAQVSKPNQSGYVVRIAGEYTLVGRTCSA